MRNPITARKRVFTVAALASISIMIGQGCESEADESVFEEYEPVTINFNGEPNEKFAEGDDLENAELDAVSYDVAEEPDPSSECFGTVYYPDDDNDGFGRHSDAYEVCPGEMVPQGFVQERDEGFDCDDTNDQVHPGNEEKCDLLDNDCSGAVDDIHPTVCYAPSELGVCPGKVTCIDGETFCDAKMPEAEVCDGLDNNCNWLIDEGCSCLNGQTQPCGSDVGECTAGTQKCVDGEWAECVGNTGPFEEVCDGLDNNCEGDVDELLVLKQPCGVSDAGICVFGSEYKVCDDGKYTDWMGCDAVFPEEENCLDGLDNDCDGEVDTGCCSVGEVADMVQCPYDPNALVFVIDNSGSMEDSDPNDNRYSGLLSVIKLLSPEDHATVVAFNDHLMTGGPFTGDKDELEDYIYDAQKYGLSSWGYDGGTAIGKAIVEGALPLFAQTSYRRTVIVLTDGETSSEDYGKYPPAMVGSLAGAHDTTVYAIGLGDNVDEDYLELISKGNYFSVDSADGIPAIYEDVFLSIGYASWRECQGDGTWMTVTGDCGES